MISMSHCRKKSVFIESLLFALRVIWPRASLEGNKVDNVKLATTIERGGVRIEMLTCAGSFVDR
jgi:hypothetical protein